MADSFLDATGGWAGSLVSPTPPFSQEGGLLQPRTLLEGGL